MTVACEHLEPVAPQKNDRVKVICGEDAREQVRGSSIHRSIFHELVFANFLCFGNKGPFSCKKEIMKMQENSFYLYLRVPLKQ